MEKQATAETPANGHMTTVEMREALALERQAREQSCLAEIQAVLKKHHCKWTAVPQIVDGRIVAGIFITAEE